MQIWPYITRELDCGLLKQLGTPKVIFKLEKRSSIIKCCVSSYQPGLYASVRFESNLRQGNVLLVAVGLWPFCYHLAASCSDGQGVIHLYCIDGD